MDRRSFIKVSGVGAGTVLLASHLNGCETAPEMYGWAPAPESLDDIRLKVLSYAILAPNPHNKQAWQVRSIGDRRLALYVDPERLLPHTDPYHRQTHIGQGTFLETLKIAASAFGHEAQVEYFPEGQYGNQSLEPLPIAEVSLLPNASVDVNPLFRHIVERQSNKRSYQNQPITDHESLALSSAFRSDSHSVLTIDSSPANRVHLQAFVTEAMAIESSDEQRDLETIAMFRFSDEEIRRYRDGFGLAQAGVTGISKFIAERFYLDRAAAESDPKGFGGRAVDTTRTQADSTVSFAWLRTEGNTRLDQVKTGEDYCRFGLLATSMGVAHHPMSQVLEEYPDMLPLQSQFKSTLGIDEGDTVQMLVRLGKAKPCVHAPRRDLQAFLYQADQ